MVVRIPKLVFGVVVSNYILSVVSRNISHKWDHLFLCLKIFHDSLLPTKHQTPQIATKTFFHLGYYLVPCFLQSCFRSLNVMQILAGSCLWICVPVVLSIHHVLLTLRLSSWMSTEFSSLRSSVPSSLKNFLTSFYDHNSLHWLLFWHK